MVDKIYIAKIGKTVGLKGQLKLHIESDFIEQFSKNASFITNKNKKLIIEKFDKKSRIVKFLDFDTIKSAEILINQQLYSTIEDTKKYCKLNKNQFFWFDLIDCIIVENDQNIGKIADIHRYPDCDYFEIYTNKDFATTKTTPNVFLLPYLQKYIINVDIENKIINTSGAIDILMAS